MYKYASLTCAYMCECAHIMIFHLFSNCFFFLGRAACRLVRTIHVAPHTNEAM